MNFLLMELNKGVYPLELIESKSILVVDKYCRAYILNSSSYSVSKWRTESPLVSLALRSNPLSYSIHNKLRLWMRMQ